MYTSVCHADVATANNHYYGGVRRCVCERPVLATIGSCVWRLAAIASGCRASRPSERKATSIAGEPVRDAVEILNVSYDPTRELYKDFNQAFAKHWAKQTGQQVTVRMSHGGSGKQARSVIDGMAADVVTLALAYDVDAIQQKAEPAARRIGRRSCRTTAPRIRRRSSSWCARGIPKDIKDWDDLVKPGVAVITPNPKTSGGARWNYLAAWGYALKRELGDLAKLKDPKHAAGGCQGPSKGPRVRQATLRPRARCSTPAPAARR